MSLQLVDPSADRDPCQLSLEIVPSGSVRLAVTAVPTWGWVESRLTFPPRPRLVTLMVTSKVTWPVVPSETSTVTRYRYRCRHPGRPRSWVMR